MSECSVCTESFTDYTRKKISCGYCSYSACKTCISRYLLSQAVDAHCMNCRTGWNREFIDECMTKTFRTGPWRDHRKNMIVQREKALLPNYQKYAFAKKKMLELVDVLKKAREDEDFVYNLSSVNSANIFRIKSEMIRDPLKDDMYTEKLKQYLQENIDITVKYTLQYVKTERLQQEYNLHFGIYNGTSKKETEKKEFIMKCVKEGCRGFLSKAYKCELCSTYVCKDCMIIKKELNDTEHTCKKEDVDTVVLINKDTRPCPKCGIRISKIDGCNQMWCTAEGCGTAFDWVSGKIVSGVVHNPHYYEWLRRNNNGQAPRNVGDVPCGGLPQVHVVSHLIRELGFTYVFNRTPNKPYQKEISQILNIHRSLVDLEYVRVPQYNVVRDDNLLKEVNIDYLLGTTDETKWKQSIYLKETNFEKKQLTCQVLNTFLNAGADIMREAVNILTKMQHDKVNSAKYTLNEEIMKPILDIITQFENLRKYINDTFEKLAETASMPVPQFDVTWFWITPSSLERIQKSKKEASKNLTTTT